MFDIVTFTDINAVARFHGLESLASSDLGFRSAPPQALCSGLLRRRKKCLLPQAVRYSLFHDKNFLLRET